MAGTTDFKVALAEVKSAYDIVEYMKSSGVDLKPAGVGKWKANCVFHNEKTPSMTVNESFQNYRCFGCDAKGDLLSFVMNYEHLSFMEALTKLADDKGISLDLSKDESGIDYKSLQNILRAAANFYCLHFNKLADDHPAKKEIEDRGLVHDNSLPEGLKYGYSPSGNALYKYLTKKGYSDDLILQSGLCRKSETSGDIFDFFRSRLMFIFTDRYNKPVGFSSRKLYEDDTRGKYVNSSESPLFKKSSVLYNHFLSRKPAGTEKTIYVVEGQFDVAAFMAAGLSNAVAASGTAFTRDHVNECRKLVGGSGRLVFCFDGDEAGAKAASKVFMGFPDIHEDAYVVTFPEGTDPCDYRQSEGDQALVDYVSSPMTIVEFMIRRTKEKHDLSSVVGRANYVDEAASIVKTVTNLTLRENCLRLLSLESMTPVNVVRDAVAAARPMKFEEVTEEAHVDAAPEGGEVSSEEEVETPSEEDIVVDLRDLAAKDPRVDLAARFINLGMTRKMWRKSVVRSRDLLPEVFYPFIEELESLEDKESVFPELFGDASVASLLLSDDFSPFYRFMELEELKEHFIFLHGRLERMVEAEKQESVRSKTLELLMSDSTGDLKYFRSLLDKEAASLEESV